MGNFIKDHRQRMALWERGLSDEQIAEELFYQPQTITKWRQKHGLKANNPRLTEQYARFEELYREEMTDSQIAKACGCFSASVRCWRIKMGLASNRDISRNRLCELHRQGLSDREIGEKLGVGPKTINSRRQRMGLPSNFRRGFPQEKINEAKREKREAK